MTNLSETQVELNDIFKQMEGFTSTIVSSYDIEFLIENINLWTTEQLTTYILYHSKYGTVPFINAVVGVYEALYRYPKLIDDSLLNKHLKILSDFVTHHALSHINEYPDWYFQFILWSKLLKISEGQVYTEIFNTLDSEDKHRILQLVKLTFSNNEEKRKGDS